MNTDSSELPRRQFRRAPALIASVGVALLGALPLAGWLLHVEALKSIIPGADPMKPNVAAAILLCGAALSLLSRKTLTKPIRAWTATIAAAVITLSALTIGEYLFDRDLGIEHWLMGDVRADLAVPHPGRMAPITAACFILVGVALFLASRQIQKRLRLPLVGALSGTLTAAGAVPLLGFLLEVLFGPSWNYMGVTPSGLAGAVAFLFLGIGLLELLRSKAHLTWSLDGFTTAGFVSGFTLMILAAGLTYNFTVKMDQAAKQVGHAREIRRELNEAEAGLLQLERDQRSYITTGHKQLLDGWDAKVAEVQEHLRKLQELEVDQSRQRKVLHQLAVLFSERLDRATRGIATAQQMVGSGVGVGLLERSGGLIEAIESDADARLRESQIQSDQASRAVFLMLPLGVFICFGILTLGVFFLNSGMGGRQRAEGALKEAEKKYRGIFENAAEGICQNTPAGHFISANPAMARMLGFDSSEELIHARNIERQGYAEPALRDKFKQMLEKNGVVTGFEYEVCRKDGTRIWVAENSRIVRDAEGRPLYYEGSVQDITQRKQAEEILRCSEARFRSMFEQSGVGMVIVGADGRLLQANEAYCQFLGYTAHELIGLDLATLTDPRDAEETKVQFADLQTGARAAIELEKRYLRKDGSVVWGRVSAHFLADLDGHRRYMAIVQDITERKAGEQARQQAEEKYRSIFENAAEGIYQSTPQGVFLAVNPAAARLLGFSTPDQMLEHTDRTSFGYVDPRRLEDFMRLVEGQNAVNGFESEVYRPDGSKVWVSENVRVVRGGDDEILFFEGTLEDVTERKRAEAEREAISEIVQGVMTTSNLDELLTLAHRSIGKLLYAENCFIALHDTKSDLVHFEFWVDKLDPLPPPQPAGKGHTRTSSVLRTGRPLVLTRELDARLFAQNAGANTGSAAASWMGVPLRTPTRTIGVLAVQHYEKEDAYSQRDLEFLSSVADQVALAIERKRADEELRQSEERLASAQKMAHVGSWEWDAITNKAIWSDEEFRLFGLEPGEREASYDLFLSFVHPGARDEAQRWFHAVRALKKSARMDVLIVRADGEERILNSWADVVLDDNDNVVRVIGTSQDVTEREKAERALGQSEERFQLVSRATDDAIWDWDVAANTISFSESFGKLFGYRADEFEPSMAFWTRGIHPDDYDALMAGVSAFFAGREEAWAAEYRFRCADGSYAFVFDRGYVVRDGEGKPLRMVGSMMNITERKRAEAERQIISEIAQGAITTSNLDGLLELAHRSIGKLLYAENCFVGLHDPKADLMTFELWVDKCDPVPPPQSHSKGFTRSSYVLRTGQPLLLTKELEAQLFEEGDLAQSGSVSASWLGVPLRTPTRTIGVLVVQHYEKQDAYSQRDLEFLSAVGDQIAVAIERKRAEVELRLAKEAAEAANRAKSEFLANMSHEIRTPMNGIIGMTDLTLETDLNRDQREYLGMVKSSAHSLLGLINDILDFSKIEAGMLELEAIDFSLRDCIGGVLKPLGLRADQKGLELMADISSDVPDHFVGDPMRLRQILINLTANAIKFTERGEVVIRVAGEAAPDGECDLHFSVTDTGIGIPPEKQKAIFEAFAQADGSTTRTHGGTGLGLSIASQLIQKMRGKIWLESKVDEGTTFHFTARLSVPATLAPCPMHTELRDLTGLRALVVDDNAVNRHILHEMLLNWRMIPTLVESGQAGLEEMLRAAESDSAYQLVLLDAVMPEMDGFTLAEKIHEQPELADATVMMLSSAMPAGSAARCKSLGIASWLTKPVTQSELLDAILTAISRHPVEPIARDQEMPVAPPVPPRKRLRILVAEDSPVNRAVATGILEKAGHLLVHAVNGREAVEAFSDGCFDLILMDVQMPEMDGFEATRCIRELEEATGGHMTIVAMTAHAMAGDRERCLAAGMDDYVSKPLRKEDLFRALGGTRVRDDEAAKDAPESTPLFNRERLLSECDGDEELMSELVSIFHDTTPRIVQALGEAVEKCDAPAVAAQAHKLLSSLGVFGAGHARTLALRLEKHGRESDFDGAKERFTELERETDKIYAALT